MTHVSDQAECERGSGTSTDGFARKARQEKREAALRIGVTGDYISEFVECFYARIRNDDMLGPLFESRVCDWSSHLDRMKAFWRSVLHNSGEFAGNPMLKHILIPGLDATHFERWLNIFYETLRDLEPGPEATSLVARKAHLIAQSLLTGIEVQRGGVRGSRAGDDLPHV